MLGQAAAAATALQNSQFKPNGRSSASVNDPYQPRHSQSLQVMNSQLMKNMPGIKDHRHTNFRDVWKKAIDKYSPKRATKLNEVSHRFQIKLEEANKIQAKREGKSTSAAPSGQARLGVGPMLRGDDDADRIKFVSMIDQKPIKPSYLELIPLKNFAKKETELTRKQAKEFTAKPESNDKQSAHRYTDVKQLFKMLKDELRKKYLEHERVLEDIKKRKEEELAMAIKYRKKIEAGKSDVPLQEEELARLEAEEIKQVYSEASQALRQRIDELDKMQLGKTEEMLLGKLIDFKAVWDYDSVEIRNKMYDLFFDWSDIKKDSKAVVSKAA